MAHVLTYDEIENLKVGDAVVEEFRDNQKYKFINLIFNGTDMTNDGTSWMEAEHYLLMCECDETQCEDYNWNYRLWNEMPTEEDLAKVSWKEDPYKEFRNE